MIMAPHEYQYLQEKELKSVDDLVRKYAVPEIGGAGAGIASGLAFSEYVGTTASIASGLGAGTLTFLALRYSGAGKVTYDIAKAIIRSGYQRSEELFNGFTEVITGIFLGVKDLIYKTS